MSDSVLIARRTFLGGAGLVAGAVVATTLVPLSVVHAVSASMTVGSSSAMPPGTWHVDDVCGHWPPYSHPVGFAGAPEASPIVARAEPVDHIFLI